MMDILALRQRFSWTQQQLADRCGVDRSTVSKWEKEAPTKGPALVLLKLLSDEASGQPTSPSLAVADAASSRAGIGTFPEAAE